MIALVSLYQLSILHKAAKVIRKLNVLNDRITLGASHISGYNNNTRPTRVLKLRNFTFYTTFFCRCWVLKKKASI